MNIVIEFISFYAFIGLGLVTFMLWYERRHGYAFHWKDTMTLLAFSITIWPIGVGFALSEWMSDPSRKLRKHFPVLKNQVRSPCCGKRGKVRSIIIHLNDTHGWPREMVADWIETLDQGKSR